MHLQDIDRSTILLHRDLENMRVTKKAYPDGWRSPSHAHENARFVFVLKGSFRERYGRRDRVCHPFSLIFRPPGEEHSEFYYDSRVVCMSVDISPKWGEYLKHNRVRLDDSKELRSAKLASVILKLDQELASGDDVSEFAIESLIIESAIEIHRHRDAGFIGKNSKWMKQAEEFIYENSTSTLTLSNIAAASGVNPVHLARTFRRKHHCTVAEYVRRLRIESSCSLLVSSSLPLAVIAAQTGFSDQSHFSRIFKRATRMTPAEYRLNFRNSC